MVDEPQRPSDPDMDVDDDDLTVPRASPFSRPPTPPATKPAGSLPPPPPGALPAAGPPGGSSPPAPPSAPPPAPPGGAPPPSAPPPAPGASFGTPGSAPPQGAPSPFQQASSTAPASSTAAPPTKSNALRNGLLGGCGCLLLILLSCCCFSGYLGYLEEGGSYDDPGEEEARVAIPSGQPFTQTFTFQGTGYGQVRAYVDVGEDAPPNTRVTGTLSCQEYDTPRPRSMDDGPSTGGEVPAGWVETPGLFMYVHAGGTATCTGTLTATPPTSMELVWTVRQRPSDWLSGI